MAQPCPGMIAGAPNEKILLIGVATPVIHLRSPFLCDLMDYF